MHEAENILGCKIKSNRFFDILKTKTITTCGYAHVKTAAGLLSVLFSIL